MDEKKLTTDAYKAYIRVVNRRIVDIEIGKTQLDTLKEISKLTYEEWVDWQIQK